MAKAAKPHPRERRPNGARAECCSTCGRPFVHNLDLHLPPIQRRIFELIERHGEIYPEILWTAIYGSDPNGGPESGFTALAVQINLLNKRLQPHGIAVRRRVVHAPEQPYRITQLAEAAE